MGLLLDAGRRLVERGTGEHNRHRRRHRCRPPVIESIDTIQDTLGGNAVTIRGRRLRDVTEVRFGEQVIEINDDNRVDGSLLVTVPLVEEAVGVNRELLTFPTGVAVTAEDPCRGTSAPLTFRYNGNQFPGGFVYQQMGPSLVPLPPDRDAGRSVSLSEDGLLLAVGSPGEGMPTPFRLGAVHIYMWNGTQWIQETVLQNTMGSDGREQGFSVSLVGSVNDSSRPVRLAVGCPGAPFGRGRVDIWIRDPQWRLESTLGPILTVENRFGFAVSLAINGDGGNTLAVGEIGIRGREVDTGSTRIFTRPPGGGWSGSPVIIIPTGASQGAQVGFSVQLNVDGTFVIIGAPFQFQENGVAWIFERTAPGTWTQRARLTFRGSRPPQDHGRSVSIDVPSGSREGTAAVGSQDGSVGIFKRNGDSWSQSAIIEQPDPSFGRTVRLFTGGGFVAIGTLRASEGDNRYRVLIYQENDDGTWMRDPDSDRNLISGIGNRSGYGSSISLSSDNTILAIGDPNPFVPGQVYVYSSTLQ